MSPERTLLGSIHLKSGILPGAALVLVSLLSGCQQLGALEAQQLSLQQAMEKNTEQTTALVEQNEVFQRSMTEAMLTLCEEQLALKNSLTEQQTERQAEQEARDQVVGQTIGDLSMRLDNAVAHLRELDKTLGTLSEGQGQEEQITIGLVLLNDTQKALQESLGQLEQGHADVLQKLTELQQGQEQSQERLNQLEQELITLKREKSPTP